MFKNKKTKQQSLNTVDNLLSTYLQTTDKKILKSKKKLDKGKKNDSINHKASKLLEMNSQLGKFRENLTDLKKFKRKERLIRSKQLKKVEEINEKIIRQSKLINKDEDLINDIINSKVKQIEKKDLVNKDEDLLELQNDILKLTKVENTKNKLKELRSEEVLANKRRNARINEFNDKITKGYISVKGLTPGLAQPGDDDSDEESSEEEDEEEEGISNSNKGKNNELADFKDDFDDYL